MNPPRVSVLMPVHNAERYVAEATESILAQSFADFEFLIIDDGSTDGSLAILQQYAARDPRIRLSSRPNTGYVTALNEMLRVARGEFIARMDADDISMPERFERQVEFLCNNPTHIAIGTLVTLIDPDGDPLCDFLSATEHEEIDQAHMNGHGGAIAHPSLMIRRVVLLDMAGYSTEFYPAEDTDLFLRLAERGRLSNVPEILLKYRRHFESTGHIQHCKQEDAKWRAIAAARIRRGHSDVPVGHALKSTPISTAEQYRMWAWWALGGGHLSTARKHAIRAVQCSPFSLATWKVVFSSLRGR